MSKTEDKPDKTFVQTLPGIIAAVAALITAIGGCIAVVFGIPAISNLVFGVTPTPTVYQTSVPPAQVVIEQTPYPTYTPFPTNTFVPPTAPPPPTVNAPLPAAAPQYNLIGSWYGSTDCTVVFYKDDGNSIDGSCDNSGFKHKISGTYSDNNTISITITRIELSSGCETSVNGYITIVDNSHLTTYQEGWNGCGVITSSVTTSLTR